MTLRVTHKLSPRNLDWWLVFLAFFPYPAISLGHATGLQPGYLVAVLALPAIWRSAGVRSRQGLFLWVAPFLLCTTYLLFSGALEHPNAAIHDVLAQPLEVLYLLVGSAVGRRWSQEALLRPVAAAILVHVVVGAIQVVEFRKGIFPFASLYHNPSFTNIAADGKAYALYTHRPFGLFPESSAMAASVAPWLLLAFYYVFIERSGRRPSLLLLSALLAGSALLVASSSGFIVFVIPAGLVIAILCRSRRKENRIRYGVTALIVLFLIPGLAYGYEYWTSNGARRLSLSHNHSWSQRLASLEGAVHLLFSGTQAMLLGLGAGQSPAALAKYAATGALGGNSSSFVTNAIDSATMTHLVEAGLLGGGIPLVVMIVFVFGDIRRDRDGHLKAVLLGMEFIALTVVTSYVALSPIWLLVGILTGPNESRKELGNFTPNEGSGGIRRFPPQLVTPNSSLR